MGAENQLKAQQHGQAAVEQLRRAARLDSDRFGSLLQAAEAALRGMTEEQVNEALGRG